MSAIVSSVISSVSSIVLSIVLIVYFKFIHTGSWECIEKDALPGQYIIARMSMGNANCLYHNEFPGCYVIDEQGKRSAIQKRNSERRCKNIIDSVNDKKMDIIDLDETYTMQTFTCGKGSTQEQLWGMSGYEISEGDCALIKKKLDLTPYKLFQTIF